MGHRADNYDGSCREILTGKHAGKWRVQYIQETESGVKRRLSRIFPTKAKAKTFLQSLRRGQGMEQAARSNEVTLGEWFDWLAENDWPESIAPFTIATRRARFGKYSRATFMKHPLSKIEALEVRSFLSHLRSQGVGNSVLKEIKGDLVRVFNQAISPYGIVPATVANPFRIPLAKSPARVAVALTPEEVRSALRNPDLNESQRAMLGLFLLAGLRLGEVMSITKGQIRLSEGLILVDRSVHVDYGGKQSVGPPKGGKLRMAVMCETLKSIMAPFIAEMGPQDVLWPAVSENKPRMKKRFYEAWKAAAAKAALPPEMSPHDCRLTHINLIEKLMPKVSPTTLKEHVGHSATGVTEANYTRPITASQQILRRELDRVFGSKSK